MLLNFPAGEHVAFRIESGRTTLGSAEDRDVVLAVPGVDAAHACLINDRRGLVLEVAEGASDVFVNARPIRAKALLRLGDIVHIGGVEIRLSSETEHIKLPPALDPEAVPEEWSRDKADASAAPRVVLRGITGSWFGKLVVLRGRTIIGRDEECDLQLDDPELSRRHAQIENSPEGIILRDLGSSNGTFVNGVQVRDAILAPGDQISFDVHRFVLEAPGHAARDLEDTAEPVKLDNGNTKVVPIIRGPKPGHTPPPPKVDADSDESDESNLWWVVAAALVLVAIVLVLLLG